MNIVENEITALTIAKPNVSIVNLYDVFYNRGETILILEYATEKDLHIYLDNEGAFEEEQACKIMYQVLKAIEFLHSKQVLHLDIKPENVLLMNPLGSKSTSLNDNDTEEVNKNETVSEINNSAEVEVKLCDFSFSQIMMPGKPILGMMGTVAYSAPEVLQYDALTKATDMWSLGVLAHVLLTEYTPFGNGTEELNQTQTNILNVREKDFECVDDYFDDVSYEAKNFIENLIKFRPRQRLTIEQALSHSWFKKYDVHQSSTSKEASQIPASKKQLDINSCEDNKENFSQEKCLPKINQNHSTNTNGNNSIKLLSTNYELTTMNKKNKIDGKLQSSDNLVIIKDDKNNNIIPSLVENQLSAKIVPVTDLSLPRKSIDIIEATSFSKSTANRLANENIETKNLESAN